MIEILRAKLSDKEPNLSIVLAVSRDLIDQVEYLFRYLIEIDCTDVEVLTVVTDDRVQFHEPSMKNAAIEQAQSQYLAFTNLGVYPPASLIYKTRRELDLHPDALVIAYRLDGTRDHGVFPNPYAVGDWQCMTSTAFSELGGYSTAMEQAGGIDGELMARAVHKGNPIVLMDERVFHAWHPERFNELQYSEASARNAERGARYGWQATLFYPDRFVFADTNGERILETTRQADSVVDMTSHSPSHPQYWDCIAMDKARRVGTGKYSVLTRSPVAVDSHDHKVPKGAILDASSDPNFVVEMQVRCNKEKLRVLDLGCAGGQMVADFLLAGHDAVGLEGSDEPMKRDHCQWPTLAGRNLFTADITKPLWVLEDGTCVLFDVITAWDVMEHIAEVDLPAVMDNIISHLSPDGLFVATIAVYEDGEYHQTVKSSEWWHNLLLKYMEPTNLGISFPIRHNSHGLAPHFMYRMNLKQSIEVRSSITVQTDYPIASESEDHLKPKGALVDRKANRDFIPTIESMVKNRPIRLLDMGCACGGVVQELLDGGHIAVGLECTDAPLLSGAGPWQKLFGNYLFLCDISEPFEILESDSQMKFDLIMAWDVLEHIEEIRVPMVVKNILGHLKDGGLFAATIGLDVDAEGNYHRCIKPIDWWHELLGKHMERLDGEIPAPTRRCIQPLSPHVLYRKPLREEQHAADYTVCDSAGRGDRTAGDA